jgi:hypothetical protein
LKSSFLLYFTSKVTDVITICNKILQKESIYKHSATKRNEKRRRKKINEYTSAINICCIGIGLQQWSEKIDNNMTKAIFLGVFELFLITNPMN